ncbi:hypothetical protein Skr01_28930 [Sphaerisporangium krabiense]|uniref:Uncharacterized protein n=1 Tax=Sphaerisporangium krabiense TaxID=763782 RepID=A0A7W8ZAC1_9ACTN|nr:hypothetical protein [Sphaerisporangium krabiense]MBB5630240.1 hypothetical protein [Sphaerisporangium krabiense]GII62808.1 hypothetical protein Skr01_28930 [Sphaerisporangium krabiense]
MRVRRFQAVAVLAMALGAGVLAAAAPAAAAPVADHAVTSALAPPDWYRSPDYPTLAECRVGRADALANGQFNAVGNCYYYAGDQVVRAAYYFNIYIP